MRRLPRLLQGIPSMTEGELSFDDRPDLRGGDTVVFDDGVLATVNGVSVVEGGGIRVVLGEAPDCAPRPHSGGRVPEFEADGVTPYGSAGESAEEEGA